MSERLTPLVLDEYFHIYNRGNSKQTIFKSNSDYLRFMSLLYLSNGTKSFKLRDLSNDRVFDVDMGNKQVAIGAYCLMPNHFHILLKPLVENGVSLFMKKLGTGYSMYFNKRYGRTGGLFEGRYKSQHADSDEYLKYLFSYIHLNPLKLIDQEWKVKGLDDIKGGEEYLNKYSFSSYKDYVGNLRKERNIINREGFPEYFPSKDSFIKEINDWMRFQVN